MTCSLRWTIHSKSHRRDVPSVTWR
uniref:Uncharacterized protein n=1 Tax=Anguilla anguilla TaxID=7936 RepID=A0A0E9U4L1_ANGAN